jgi:protein phosphatase
VTCIIGDVVDLDKGQAPPTAQEVVGAASERRVATTRATPITPAAKAAALSRQATGLDVEQATEAEAMRLAEEGPSSGLRRWLKGVALFVVVVAVLGGGGYAAYDWSQRQYFVGETKGHVAIYQGVSQNIGPWNLSHVIAESDVALSDLPDFYSGKIDSTLSSANIQDARRLVKDLQGQALQCKSTRAAGGTCGSSSATPSFSSATPVATPSGALRATPSPSASAIATP